MQEHELPTADEMLERAAFALEDAHREVQEAADWLRSDWRPLGSALTAEQGARRRALQDAVRAARRVLVDGAGGDPVAVVLARLLVALEDQNQERIATATDDARMLLGTEPRNYLTARDLL